MRFHDSMGFETNINIAQGSIPKFETFFLGPNDYRTSHMFKFSHMKQISYLKCHIIYDRDSTVRNHHENSVMHVKMTH